MSLNIYTYRNEVPSELGRVVDKNDLFFKQVRLSNTDATVHIISEIDKAQYYSEDSFKSRSGQVLPKDCLSTGSKTLLNIMSHTNKCFNIIECGNNAIDVLVKFTVGNVYWQIPVYIPIGEWPCDICIDGKHFTSIGDFSHYIMEVRDE